jgi:hypothetical protein
MPHEVYPYDMHACEMHAHKTHAYDMHAHETHAYEINTYEVHAHEVYPYEMHAREIHAHETLTNGDAVVDLSRCELQNRVFCASYGVGPMTRRTYGPP